MVIYSTHKILRNMSNVSKSPCVRSCDDSRYILFAHISNLVEQNPSNLESYQLCDNASESFRDAKVFKLLGWTVSSVSYVYIHLNSCPSTHVCNRSLHVLTYRHMHTHVIFFNWFGDYLVAD